MGKVGRNLKILAKISATSAKMLAPAPHRKLEYYDCFTRHTERMSRRYDGIPVQYDGIPVRYDGIPGGFSQARRFAAQAGGISGRNTWPDD